MLFRFHIAAILGAAMLLSVSAAAAQDKAAKGLIASRELSKELLGQCSRPAPDPAKVSGYWTPSKSEVDELEQLLPAYIKSSGRSLPIELSAYQRAYAGIVYKSRKVIYVDFSNRTLMGGGPGIVCDGGAHFFGVEYDLKTKTFSELRFNGQI